VTSSAASSDAVAPAISAVVPVERIDSRILLVRGQKVLLDRDLAELFGVETRALLKDLDEIRAEIHTRHQRMRAMAATADLCETATRVSFTPCTSSVPG
jgi:hypothetical protein